MSKTSHSAFTIIENLIIICVITFAIAGIYFSKKMAQESDVKSLIMQIKKYDAALNSFTEKYHALPGDAQGTATYGITESNTDGNGDNVITDRNQNIFQANNEITNFWMHLSKSKMIDENYDGKENEEAKVGSSFPLSKVGDKVGIIAFGANGKTFYQIGFKFADSDRLYTSDYSLKSSEALLFDKKIDDGNPQKGRVVVVGEDLLNAIGNNKCIKFGDYNQSVAIPSCQLRIEAR